MDLYAKVRALFARRQAPTPVQLEAPPPAKIRVRSVGALKVRSLVVVGGHTYRLARLIRSDRGGFVYGADLQ